METNVDNLDTPLVLVDLIQVEENIKTLFDAYAGYPGVSVRPHLKTAKCPEFARMLLNAGARGICVAKVSEAEVFVDAGIGDILITTEIAGAVKIERLINLWSRARDLEIVVDNARVAAAINEAAGKASNGHKLSVLIDLNVGQDRTGVSSKEEALELADSLSRLKHLFLCGIQGYEGHLQHLPPEERERRCHQSMVSLVETADWLRQAGHGIAIVTTGGTGTGEICASHEGITEVQPGSFIFSDAAYQKATRDKYKPALRILAGVVSKPDAKRAVVDAGLKSLSMDMGYAEVWNRPDWTYRPAGDEHGIIESSTGSLALATGDRVELVPGHIDTTIALHSEFHLTRRGKLEAVWAIATRGRVQ